MVVGDRLDFERLSERIHPAESRIRELSARLPGVPGLLGCARTPFGPVMERPFGERRELLCAALDGDRGSIHVTPLTTDIVGQARDWFTRFEGAGLDGVVAKPMDGAYQPGKRTMTKIKHAREADVVVAGYRLHKNSTPERPLLGSLQLGLFDTDGALQFVGGRRRFRRVGPCRPRSRVRRDAAARGSAPPVVG